MAVVGVGFRLPGGIHSLEELWAALDTGRDLVSEVPEDRFSSARFVAPGAVRPGHAYTGAGGFLENVTDFDAEYFGISPREASRLDPQHRLLLECAAEAFDDAGIDPGTVAGSDAAVTVGISAADYGMLQNRRFREVSPFSVSGNAASIAANRLSYVFDLNGPSMAVDTACSSALTALHHACQALRRGRGRLALAGGVNVVLSPMGHLGFSHASMLSPTGRCRPFSSAADGFVRSEGAGVLLLKPLRAALADGDRVHVVIAASGANSDGRTAGMALPSPRAQAELLRDVYGSAGIAAHEVAYVEAHGTGTAAGDPIECAALGQTLGTARNGAGPLPIGSVKSNLGHLEPASGVAGLLKGLLVLRERAVPATLHAEPLSEAIDFSALGLAPVTEAQPLKGAGRGVVGVNSFGFGGANAHVVLAPAEQPARERQETTGQETTGQGDDGHALPVVVSARTARALAEAAESWARWLESAEPDSFYDIAYTASCRRGQHEHRHAVLAESPEQAATKLRSLARGAVTPAAATAIAVRGGRVAFVFNGNGAQWAGMGQELLAQDSAFAAEVAALDAELTPRLGWSVLEEMNSPQDTVRWERTEVAQPLLFVLQAGVVAALAARGVRPSAVTGHSVGEVAAAYCAGALDSAAACRVIAERSRAQAHTVGQGRMAAVRLSEGEAGRLLAEPAYRDRLVLAAVNSDQDVTLAGDAAALEQLGVELLARSVFFRDLGLDYAFHTPAMDSLEQCLKDRLRDLAATPSRIPVVSTVTGGVVDGEELGAAYWWRNVREPVRFAEALGTLTGTQECDVLVEIGPRPVLGPYMRRRNRTAEGGRAAVGETLTRVGAGATALDGTLAQLLASGADLDWSGAFPVPGRVVSLPPYPWQRERHWSGSPEWWLEGAVPESGAGHRHPLLGARLATAEPTWQQDIAPDGPRWLADHTVGATPLMPAAAYVEMALSAGRRVYEAPAEVTGLSLTRALPLPLDDPAVGVRLSSSLAQDGRWTVTSRTQDTGDWGEHARGRVRKLLRTPPPLVDVTSLRARLTIRVGAEEHYAACAGAGLPYGPAFRPLTCLHVGDGEVLAEYAATVGPDSADSAESAESEPESSEYLAHPTLLDGALQAGMPLLRDSVSGSPAPFLPVGFARVRRWRPVPASGLVHVRARNLTEREAVWDISVMDSEGGIALELDGCTLRRYDDAASAAPQRLVQVLRAAPRPGAPASPAPPLPAPSRILRDRAPRLDALRESWHRFPYGAFRHWFLELSAHFTAAAARELLPGHTVFGVDDLVAAGATPGHKRLLEFLCDGAVEHGVLAGEGPGQWRFADEPRPAELFRAGLRDFPGESGAALALGACGENLAPVLRGERDPLELLFSEPDALAGRFYETHGLLRYTNRVARELLTALVAAWPADRPLRVLEVGAGTGATTALLLPELPSERCQYTFTDISPAFLPRAEERFADYDFLDYRRLDLDAGLAEQGFTPGSYDIVVAALALHTAPDLRRALGHVAELLTDGGHLLAVEYSHQGVPAPVFGLLESFWSATDQELRPDGPLVPYARWQRLLEECGFSEAVRAGDPALPAREDALALLAVRGARTAAHAARREPGRPGPVDEDIPARQWRVLDMAGGAFGAAVARALPDAAVRMVDAGTATREPAHWRAMLDGIAGAAHLVLVDGPVNGPVDGPVDGPGDGPTQDADPARITERCTERLAVLRALTTACAERPEGSDVTVWVVAHGVVHGATGGVCPTPPPGPAAALWGAARSLANERPRLAVRRVLCTRPGDGPEDEQAAATLAERLAGELGRGPDEDEDEVLLTRHGRFVSRVRPLPEESAPHTDAVPFRLLLTEPGLRFRLHWTTAGAPTPGLGEVVLAVGATALNYRDVMVATDRVPGGSTDLGLECAGTVIAVGPGVTGVAVGDRVAGAGHGCFGSHLVARADRLLPIPDSMSFARAATLPSVAVTVHHSLGHLARLAPGETVLVHGAAGGVGLAALQYARHVGAHVIATAGSPAKRDLLRLLGVEHVLDSRSLSFVEEVRDVTGGEGVDVVLNSLAGEALVRGLDLLKPHGRFLELGKRDFLADNPLPMGPFLRNLTFHGVDVEPLLAESSPLADAQFAAVREAFEQGVYAPLPHRTYPAARVREAFSHLQHSRHIGKVVVTFDEPVRARRHPETPALDPEAAYLVVGGLSGFGAATARHLAARGARRLGLVSRRGLRAPEARALVDDLEARGVRVGVHAADAADPEAMRGILGSVDAEGRRLGGVVHAAMVLHDADLTELSDEQIRAVLTPKVTAGHVLDTLTRDRDLDFFVVYSSAAALAGNFRQSAYAAANHALEALVHDRRRSGLPALAMQWGAVSDTGYVHRSERAAEMRNYGLGDLTSDQALAELDRSLARRDMETVACGHFDWGRLHRFLHNLRAPRTAGLLPSQEEEDGAEGLRAALASAAGPEEAHALVLDVLRKLFADTLQTAPDRIDPDRRLDQLGLDSLMAAELALRVRSRFGSEVPVVELAGAGGLNPLAHRILARLGHGG